MDSYLKAVFKKERVISAIKSEDKENISQKILHSINEVESEEERKNEEEVEKNKKQENKVVEVKI